MDPNANLQEQLAIAKHIIHTWDNCNDDGTLSLAQAADVADDANRLADLIVALDEWIRKGGYLPKRWSK